jgi:hypothetical protein
MLGRWQSTASVEAMNLNGDARPPFHPAGMMLECDQSISSSHPALDGGKGIDTGCSGRSGCGHQTIEVLRIREVGLTSARIAQGNSGLVPRRRTCAQNLQGF